MARHPNSLANLKPFEPGVSGNPKGRKTAGASVREWMNVLGEQDLTVPELRAIAADEKLPALKRAAAERIVRMTERPNLADFADYIDGEVGIKDLAASGIDTAIVKKAKTRKRTYETQAGTSVTEVEREIELHDRSGEEFDRVCDRTEGRPTQAIDVSATNMPSAVKIIFDEPPDA
jgi:hypothetical protein